MIVVTGGAGFIGSTLVDKLIAKGHSVTIIDNLSTGKESNINRKADLVHYDVCDKFPDIKAELVFHIAALARIQPSFKDPTTTFKANSLGTVNALEFARKNGVKIVYPGSSSAYENEYANPYTYTKWLGENHCKLYKRVYGVPIGIARFFNVYGPRQIDEGAYATVIGIFERQKKNNEPLTITGDGEQRRDFTHVDDITDGLIALAEKDTDQEIYQFGTGKNYSINEVAAMFKHPTTYIPKRPGEGWMTLADIREAKEKLSYKPKHNLAEYISRSIGSDILLCEQDNK